MLLQENTGDDLEFVKSLLADNADPEHVRDWMKVRHKKRASNSPTAYKGLVREAGKAGITVADAVRICAEQSWQGFTLAYYENLMRRTQPSYQPKSMPRQTQEPDINNKYKDPDSFDWGDGF